MYTYLYIYIYTYTSQKVIICKHYFIWATLLGVSFSHQSNFTSLEEHLSIAFSKNRISQRSGSEFQGIHQVRITTYIAYHMIDIVDLVIIDILKSWLLTIDIMKSYHTVAYHLYDVYISIHCIPILFLFVLEMILPSM